MTTPHRHPRHRSTGLLPVAILAFGVACAGPAEFLRRPERPITWPADPEHARIGYVLSYHGNEDVDRHPGFFAGLFEWIAGEEDVQLVSPAGSALAAGQMLWIADPGRGCVHRLSLVSGEHLIVTGTDEQPMQTPVGVAIAPGGRAYVTDSTAARVFVVDADGAVVDAFGDAATLGRPTGIAYDAPRQRLLLLDTTGCRILACDLDGRVVATAGGRGDRPGQFNYPTNLAVGADGQIVVTDSLNFRIQVLDGDLRPLAAFGMVGRGPGTFASPKGVALDSDGHVYVVDALFDNVQIFDPSGQLLLRFGSRGSQLGELYLPTGIHIDAEDRIFVSDAGNARVQVFRYLGSRP